MDATPGTIKLLRQATDGLKEVVLYFSGVIGLSNMTYGIVSIIVFPILISTSDACASLHLSRSSATIEVTQTVLRVVLLRFAPCPLVFSLC